MTTNDEERYQNSQVCWICNEKINKGKDKERDYCYITVNLEELHIKNVI